MAGVNAVRGARLIIASEDYKRFVVIVDKVTGRGPRTCISMTRQATGKFMAWVHRESLRAKTFVSGVPLHGLERDQAIEEVAGVDWQGSLWFVANHKDPCQSFRFRICHQSLVGLDLELLTWPLEIPYGVEQGCFGDHSVGSFGGVFGGLLGSFRSSPTRLCG